MEGKRGNGRTGTGAYRGGPGREEETSIHQSLIYIGPLFLKHQTRGRKSRENKMKREGGKRKVKTSISNETKRKRAPQPAAVSHPPFIASSAEHT